MLRDVSPRVPPQVCWHGEGARGGLGVQRVPCGDAGREHGEPVSGTCVDWRMGVFVIVCERRQGCKMWVCEGRREWGM